MQAPDYDLGRIQTVLDHVSADLQNIRNQFPHLHPQWIPTVTIADSLLCPTEREILQIVPGEVNLKMLPMSLIQEQLHNNPEVIQDIHRVLFQKMTPLLFLLNHPSETKAMVIPMIFQPKNPASLAS